MSSAEINLDLETAKCKQLGKLKIHHSYDRKPNNGTEMIHGVSQTRTVSHKLTTSVPFSEGVQHSHCFLLDMVEVYTELFQQRWLTVKVYSPC